MDISAFPNPPMDSGSQENYYYKKPYNQQTVYDQNNNPIQVEMYPPSNQPAPPSQPTNTSGLSFGNLIGGNVYVEDPKIPMVTERATDTGLTVKKRGRPPKNKDKDAEPVNSKEIVESTVYEESYTDTNNMAYAVISQADELMANAKAELDFIRNSRGMKGKYMYMTNMLSSMSSLMGTKLQAIREINANITKANDMEYRRFKDNRALLQVDDNKMIMDAYSAFINTPVGAKPYSQPTTKELTMAVNDLQMVPADGVDLPLSMTTQDRGLANYLNNISPEENRMLNEGNPDIEEVIIYNQETGMKYFQWINTKTNEPVPNMPASSDILIEDYVIDPRTRTAKNTNLRDVKKVVYINEEKFDQY